MQQCLANIQSVRQQLISVNKWSSTSRHSLTTMAMQVIQVVAMAPISIAQYGFSKELLQALYDAIDVTYNDQGDASEIPDILLIVMSKFRKVKSQFEKKPLWCVLIKMNTSRSTSLRFVFSVIIFINQTQQPNNKCLSTIVSLCFSLNVKKNLFFNFKSFFFCCSTIASSTLTNQQVIFTNNQAFLIFIVSNIGKYSICSATTFLRSWLLTQILISFET